MLNFNNCIYFYWFWVLTNRLKKYLFVLSEIWNINRSFNLRYKKESVTYWRFCFNFKQITYLRQCQRKLHQAFTYIDCSRLAFITFHQIWKKDRSTVSVCINYIFFFINIRFTLITSILFILGIIAYNAGSSETLYKNKIKHDCIIGFFMATELFENLYRRSAESNKFQTKTTKSIVANCQSWMIAIITNDRKIEFHPTSF